MVRGSLSTVPALTQHGTARGPQSERKDPEIDGKVLSLDDPKATKAE